MTLTFTLLNLKIATRFQQATPADPKVAIKLYLDREKSLSRRVVLSQALFKNSRKEITLETDLNSLVHIIDQLESARTSVNIKNTATIGSQPAM